MCKISQNFLLAAAGCSKNSKKANHGAYINTAQGVSASNSTNTRLNKKTVPSVHAECQVLKIARNRRQCLKEPRRLCCSNS